MIGFPIRRFHCCGQEVIHQAVAQMVGMGMEMCRVNRGLRERIDILEMMQDPKTLRDKRRTPYEGIPKSFTTEEVAIATI